MNVSKPYENISSLLNGDFQFFENSKFVGDFMCLVSQELSDYSPMAATVIHYSGQSLPRMFNWLVDLAHRVVRISNCFCGATLPQPL